MNKGSFLILGASALIAALTFSHSAIAESSLSDSIKNSEISTVQEMKDEIFSVIAKQKDLGFLTKDAQIDVGFVNELILDSAGKTDVEKTGIGSPLANNFFRLSEKGCNVELSFSEDGQAGYFGFSQEGFDKTKTQNNLQKKMVREFIALHEHFHCEFSKLSQPIMLGDDEEYNKKANHYLMGYTQLGGIYSGYSGLLNENFADIAAAMALTKKYGAGNEDLGAVLLNIYNQRKEIYEVTSIADTHFTHFSFESYILENHFEKVADIKDGNEFRAFALKIANSGTQSVMADRGKVFADEILLNSVVKRITAAIMVEKSPSKEMLAGIENSNAGLSQQIAENILLDKEVKGKLSKAFWGDNDIVKFTSLVEEIVSNSAEFKKHKEEAIEFNRGFEKVVFEQKEKEGFNGFYMQQQRKPTLFDVGSILGRIEKMREGGNNLRMSPK